MLKALLRRLILIPPILVVVHFASFVYAFIALQAQKASNPWGSSGLGFPSPLTSYQDTLNGLLHFDFGRLPGTGASISSIFPDAVVNSLGLLLAAFMASLVIGLLFGFFGVQLQPARLAKWLPPIAALGLAMPGFFVGSLFITATLYCLLSGGPNTRPIFPLTGFGWDSHLVIPIFALTIRPAAQIAQMAASLLVEELEKPYVTTARSIGHTWNSARWRHALRNILAPLTLGIASSLRWMMAEVILVEWIFDWPGLGRMLATTLIPPKTAGPVALGNASIVFLYPPLLSLLMTLFSFAFLSSDILASSLAQAFDPRLQITREERRHG